MVTIWIICKLLFPLVFWGFIIYNLPSIIGGILGGLIALLLSPFILSFMAFRHWYQNREEKQTSTHQEEYKYHKKFEEPQNSAAYDSKDLYYNLLGVRVNASKEELKAAFKKKMMMNHPDRLASLDPELQRIAGERTVAIKDAYERLSGITH